MNNTNEAPELEQLLRSDSDEPIVVNPPPPKSQRRVRFAKSYQRIFSESKYHRLTLEHINKRTLEYYTTDIFHTLVNMRSYRFFLLFVASYIGMYSFYALLYYSQPEHCIFHVENYFHALWFSVITAATIGYGHQAPDPDCYLVNMFIMMQVMTGALMQAALLGLVFSRFSAPGKRARTIKFSSIMTCYKGPDGYLRLCFRVVNLRKHQILQPEVSLLLIRREITGGPGVPLEYRYRELPVTHISGRTKIWLGLPSIIAHKIDESSPLWGVSPEALDEEEGLEFIALLDGIDETTSTVMQARHAYSASDIRWGHSFAGVLHRGGSGALTADYSQIDRTRSEDIGIGDYSESGSVHGNVLGGGDVAVDMYGIGGTSTTAGNSSTNQLVNNLDATVDLEAAKNNVRVVLPNEEEDTMPSSPFANRAH